MNRFVNSGTRAVLLAGILLAALAAPFLVGPAGANITGEPDITLTVADNSVSAGESTELTVNVVNRADISSGSESGNTNAEARATTAHGLTLKPSDSGPITVRTNTVAVGKVADGTAPTASFDIAVAEDAEPGTYEIPVEVQYKYSEFISERDTHSERVETVEEDRTVRVVVDEEADIEVVDVVAKGPGESGTFVLDLQNNGTATANDAVVSLSSLSSDLQFGNGEASQVYVSEWHPGERRTLRFRGTVTEGAPRSALPVSLAIDYEDNDSVAFDSTSTFGITPEVDQTFRFDDVESTLRVAQDGELTGTVVNDGPQTAHNVVVTLEPPNRNVEVLEPEVALGTLEPGEAVDVNFEVEVSSSARAGPRQFSLTPTYENADGDTRTADDVRFRERVRDRRDAFVVETRESGVTAGGTGRVVLAVTNNRNETVTDVSAKLFSSDPLSVDDDQAFVDELEPGETVTVPFRVSAGGSAMQKAYPVSVDFQYVDASGETKLSDSYRLPVRVSENSGGIFGLAVPTLPTVAVALVLVPLAPLLLRRRRG